jgi:hypothetical protein
MAFSTIELILIKELFGLELFWIEGVPNRVLEAVMERYYSHNTNPITYPLLCKATSGAVEYAR